MEKSFNTKLYIKEIFQCFMATTFVGIGVAMFISCKLGSDSLTVFLDGMNHSFGIPVSIVNQCAAVIILLLAIILNKKAIGINTVVSAISIGFCIEVGNLIITPFHIAEQTWIARFIFIYFCSSSFIYRVWMDANISARDELYGCNAIWYCRKIENKIYVYTYCI